MLKPEVHERLLQEKAHRRRALKAALLVTIAVLGLDVAIAGIWEAFVQFEGSHGLRLVSVKARREGDVFQPAYFPNDVLLQLTFKSPADYQSFAMRNDFGLFYRASPCKAGSVDIHKELWSDVSRGLFDGLDRVDSWAGGGSPQGYRKSPSGPRDTSGEIGYSIFMNARFKKANVSEQYQYDLMRKPVDICVTLNGVSHFYGIGPVWRSQVFVIPQAAVRDALERAGAT